MKKSSTFFTKRLGLFVLILAGCIAVTGCSKNDPKPSETQDQLLTKASWNKVTISVQTDNGAWVDKPTDDYYQQLVYFTAITFSQGGNATADVYYKSKDAGSWTLTSNTLDVNLKNTGDNSFTVDKLDDSTLVIEWSQSGDIQDTNDAKSTHIKAIKQTFTH